jgi:hypothetical protein
MNKRTQIALFGGFGGLVGAFAVFLPLTIAFISGDFINKWAETKSPFSLTQEGVLMIWGLFLGLVFGIPLAVVISVLRRKAPGKWYAELPESKRQSLSYFVIGIISGIPGGLTSVRLGLRPGKLPAEMLIASLAGLLIGFLGGLIVANMSSYGPKSRAIGVLLAIGFSAELGECSILGIIAGAFAIALMWPSSSKQGSYSQEAGASGPTRREGDPPMAGG